MQPRASSLATSNRNQMMKEIKSLKEEIDSEQRQQWNMMKTILHKHSEKAKVDQDAEKEVFRRAASSVVHPFSHIAHNDTIYEYRQRSTYRPQNVYTHRDKPFYHKKDNMQIYSESMYVLGPMAPAPRKPAPALPQPGK